MWFEGVERERETERETETDRDRERWRSDTLLTMAPREGASPRSPGEGRRTVSHFSRRRKLRGLPLFTSTELSVAGCVTASTSLRGRTLELQPSPLLGCSKCSPDLLTGCSKCNRNICQVVPNATRTFAWLFKMPPRPSPDYSKCNPDLRPVVRIAT